MISRVLAIHGSCELYGADRIFISTLSFLKKKYDLDVVIPCGGVLYDELISYNPKVNVKIPVVVKSLFSLSYFIKLFISSLVFFIFMIKKRISGFNIVYINTLSLAIVVVIARLLFFKKIVLHSHEMVGHHGIMGRLLVTLCCVFASKIICVSNAVRINMLENSWIKVPNKLCVVHNGIKDVFSSNAVKEKTDLLRLVLIGRIMPEKGHWYLVDALKLLPATLQENIEITVVGGPPPHRKGLRDEFFLYIQNSNLNVKFKFIDFVSNPYKYLELSDFSLVPSMMNDPFPTTVLESLMMSKPVIVTNNGGSIEIIKDGYNGYIIPNNRADVFADTLKLLLDARFDFDILSNNARNSYLNGLDIISFEKRFIDAFI